MLQVTYVHKVMCVCLLFGMNEHHRTHNIWGRIFMRIIINNFHEMFTSSKNISLATKNCLILENCWFFLLQIDYLYSVSTNNKLSDWIACAIKRWINRNTFSLMFFNSFSLFPSNTEQLLLICGVCCVCIS